MSMNTSNDITCPVCGEETLKQVEYSLNLDFKAGQCPVDGFIRSVCESCKTETTNAKQSLHNKRISLEARKKIDGLLSGAEIRAFRHEYKLTQQQAATLFGGGLVAFSKYEKGDVAQSTSMDRLLRVIAGVPEAYGWLQNYMGVAVDKVDEKSDENSWKYCKATVLEATNFQKNKKAHASYVQYEEIPFIYETTLAASVDDEYEKYDVPKELLA